MVHAPCTGKTTDLLETKTFFALAAEVHRAMSVRTPFKHITLFLNKGMFVDADSILIL